MYDFMGYLLIISMFWFSFRTNLPKEIMAFPGFPFPTNVKESFVNHRVVLSYLESFAEHFNLKPFIKVCIIATIPIAFSFDIVHAHFWTQIISKHHTLTIFDVSWVSTCAVGKLLFLY